MAIKDAFWINRVSEKDLNGFALECARNVFVQNVYRQVVTEEGQAVRACRES